MEHLWIATRLYAVQARNRPDSPLDAGWVIAARWTLHWSGIRARCRIDLELHEAPIPSSPSLPSPTSREIPRPQTSSAVHAAFDAGAGCDNLVVFCFALSALPGFTMRRAAL